MESEAGTFTSKNSAGEAPIKDSGSDTENDPEGRKDLMPWPCKKRHVDHPGQSQSCSPKYKVGKFEVDEGPDACNKFPEGRNIGVMKGNVVANLLQSTSSVSANIKFV